MTQGQRTGVPMVVSAPSGAGKTTLCRRLMAELDGVAYSVSHTTRQPRGSEQHGVDYYFVDDPEFDRLVTDEAFLEWAHVHGQRYGTSADVTAKQLSRGIDVLFDIDVQGGRQIAERLPEALLVFILPPNMATLEHRLRGRNSDAAEEIARRLEAARQEIEAASFYSHWIVNGELEQATSELRSILVAERLRRLDKNALRRYILDAP